MKTVLARHPYFGEVTVEEVDVRAEVNVTAEGPLFEGWRVPLNGVFGIRRDDWQDMLDAAKDDVRRVPADLYQRLLPLLSRLQTFCEALPEKDHAAKGYFVEFWPKSAGEFELFGDGLIFYEQNENTEANPHFSFLKSGQCALVYWALDDEVWKYAGIEREREEFHVIFDESGELVGVEEEIDTRYKALPDVIEAFRLEDSYNHPYFGEFDLTESDTLKTITVDGREVDIDLYMKRETYGDFRSEKLDQFVPLLENLDRIDAQVRASIPEETRLNWLGDRMEFDVDERTEKLAQMFPGVKKPQDISPEAFAKALWLDSISLSLSPEDSGGAAMTLDYLIFPVDEDGEIFTAYVSADGELMDIVLES